MSVFGLSCSISLIFAAGLDWADAASDGRHCKGSQRCSSAALLQDHTVLLQTKTERKIGNQHKAVAKNEVASKDPLDPGWFGNFDQAESTYTSEGLDASHDYPAQSVMHGADPSLANPINDFESFPAKWFHESRSAGPMTAWQTDYPAVSGSIAGGRDARSNPWEYTPEGYYQEYQQMAASQAGRPVAGLPAADWFDNSVHQIDGYGRYMTPSREDGEFYVEGGPKGSKLYAEGWQEKSVNTTITCATPGCNAWSALQLYDPNVEEARLCKVSVDVHPTDYDDDWSREHIAYWSFNKYIITRQCNPRARGCNSTADRPLYPCVNSFPVDSLMAKTPGKVVIEGQNTPMVDECPYNGNLLSAVAMGTCMVRKLTTTTTTTAAAAALFTIAGLHGSQSMMCNTPGCAASMIVRVSPALALNGGKCLMDVSIAQTDFDDDLGEPEKVEWLMLEGTNLTTKMEKDSRAPEVNKKKAASQFGPGKNPCTMRYMNQTLTEADEKFLAIKSYDVTKLITQTRPLGALHVSAKISPHVDECGYKGNLLYAEATIKCTPPKKYAAKAKKATKKR